jgi:hypothetical protein
MKQNFTVRQGALYGVQAFLETRWLCELVHKTFEKVVA